jgi:hypothetical protein
MAVAVTVAAMAVAAIMVEAVSTVAAAFMVAVLPFTAAVSEAAAQRSMAADFAAVMFSTAAAFATAASRSDTTFTGTIFTVTSIMRRPITITRIAIAGWSGHITDRARSAAIAHGITTTGATTGIIASTGIGEVRSLASC